MPKPSLPDFYKIICPEKFEMGKSKGEKSGPPAAELMPGVKELEKIIETMSWGKILKIFCTQ